MRPFFKRLLIKRSTTVQRNQVTPNGNAVQPLVYLRLRAARAAQVSFVEFEVPNKP